VPAVTSKAMSAAPSAIKSNRVLLKLFFDMMEWNKKLNKNGEQNKRKAPERGGLFFFSIRGLSKDK
jgi:hypothetical protein